MKQLIFSSILTIMLLLSLDGCSLIYYIANKSEVDSNRVLIYELSEIFKKRPLEFFNKVKLDTICLAHDIDSLGFGFVIERGTFRYNKYISFGIQIIREDDSIYSYSIEPYVGYPVMIDGDLYVPNYEKAGWKIKDYNNFYERYYRYDFSILPVNYNYEREINKNPMFKYLMSPYSGYIILNEPGHFELQNIFNELKNRLGQDDIFYLLHSLNPATRAIVMKYIKCSGKTFNQEIQSFVDILINTSPNVHSLSGCFLEDEDLKDIIKCY